MRVFHPTAALRCGGQWNIPLGRARTAGDFTLCWQQHTGVFPVVLNSSTQAVPHVVAKHYTEKALPGPGPGLGKKDAGNPLSPLPSPWGRDK